MKYSTKPAFRIVLFCILIALCLSAAFMHTQNAHADGSVIQSVEFNLGDKIGFFVYTNVPYASNVGAKFEVNGRTSPTSGTSAAIPYNGYCVFKYDDLYPHELASEITMSVYQGNNLYGKYSGITAKAALLEMLQSSDSERRQFASDLLYYGEQTREYRNLMVPSGEKLLESITDDISTNAYPNYKPRVLDESFSVVGQAPGLGQSASAVRMKSIGISYYNTNRYVVFIEMPSSYNVANASLSINGTSYSGSSFELVEDDSSTNLKLYKVQSNPLKANEFFTGTTPKTTSFNLTYGTRVVHSANYSVKDYVLQLMQTEGEGASAQALLYAKSLYAYALSATNLYPGAYTVGAVLVSAPGNVTSTSDTADKLQPSGGSVNLFMSDGTTVSVTPTWSKVDDVTGTDHNVPRVTSYKYTDSTTGRSFNFTASISVLNPLVSIERYTDPNNFQPTASSWATTAPAYKPTTGKVKATWSNGHFDYVTPTYTAVNLTGYQEIFYTQIPVKVSYQSNGVTKTIETSSDNPVKFIFNNIPASKTLSFSGNVTARFTGGNDWTTPTGGVFKVTLRNGQQITVTSSTSWSQIQYQGTELSDTVSSTATYEVNLNTQYTKYTSGTTSQVSGGKQTFTYTKNVSFTNYEEKVEVTAATSYEVNSSAKITDEEGYLGTELTITLGNGKKLINTLPHGASITWSTSAGITGSQYEKDVTLTHKYTKGHTGGNTIPNQTNTLTLVNKLDYITPDIVTVTKTAKKYEASNQASKWYQITASDISFIKYFKNGYSATQSGGVQLKLSDSNVTNIYVVNSTAANFTFEYTKGYSGYNSSTGAASGAYRDLQFEYTTNGETVDTTFKVIIDNSAVTLTQTTTYPTVNARDKDYDNVSWTLSNSSLRLNYPNGATSTPSLSYLTFKAGATVMPSCLYVQNIIDNKHGLKRVSSAKEETATTRYYVSVVYKDDNGHTATLSTFTVVVNNPLYSISRYTDAVRKATSTSAVSGNTWKTGNYQNPEVKLKYTNNYEETDYTPDSISGSVTLSDNAPSKSGTLTASVTKNDATKTCTIYGFLYNEYKSGCFTNWTGNGSSNRATISSSGLSVKINPRVTLSNDTIKDLDEQTKTVTSINGENLKTTLLLQGNGDQSITTSAVDYGSAIYGYKNGSYTSVKSAWTLQSFSQSPNIYWKNPVQNSPSKPAALAYTMNGATNKAKCDTSLSPYAKDFKLANGKYTGSITPTVSNPSKYVTTATTTNAEGTATMYWTGSNGVTYWIETGITAVVSNPATYTYKVNGTSVNEGVTVKTYLPSNHSQSTITFDFYISYANGLKSTNTTYSCTSYQSAPKANCFTEAGGSTNNNVHSHNFYLYTHLINGSSAYSYHRSACFSTSGGWTRGVTPPSGAPTSVCFNAAYLYCYKFTRNGERGGYYYYDIYVPLFSDAATGTITWWKKSTNDTLYFQKVNGSIQTASKTYTVNGVTMTFSAPSTCSANTWLSSYGNSSSTLNGRSYDGAVKYASGTCDCSSKGLQSGNSATYRVYGGTTGSTTHCVYVQCIYGSAPSSGSGCFDGNTQITMSDGATKSIKDIVSGDYVRSYDEKLDEFVSEIVTNTYTYDNAEIYEIQTVDGNKIRVTDSHPFLTTDGWKAINAEAGFKQHAVVCGTLNAGDFLISQSGTTQIANIISTGEYTTVYNLEISNTHTFIANGAIVHNSIEYVELK